MSSGLTIQAVEVDNGIYVDFPITPKYTFDANNSHYVAVTDNCMLFVLIHRNAIPDYGKYFIASQKWSEIERKNVSEVFLDSVIKGRMHFVNGVNNAKQIMLGPYYGRKMIYSAINPVTGVRGKRISQFYLIKDKIVSFDCWIIEDNLAAYKEMNLFYGSIRNYKGN